MESPTCRQNYSFFTTASFMVISYHSIALVNIPLSVLAFYVIIRKTPPAMRKMKPALIFTQICATNLDFTCTVLSCPFAFFPSAAGLTLGILSKLGIGMRWQGYWGQVAIALNGVAIMMLYENRQSQIATIRLKITSETTRKIFYLSFCILSFLVMIPFYLNTIDQVEMRNIVLAMIPCPSIEFFEPGVYVTLKPGEMFSFYSLLVLMSLILFFTFFFAFHSLFHIIIVPNVKLSKATRTLQRKYLWCVTLQICIPMIVLVFPTVYSFYTYQYTYYNQAYNNFALLAFSSHGFLATLFTVIIYKPYRDVVFSCCRRDLSIGDSTREVISVQI